MHAGVQAIAAGSQYSMVLKEDGSVWATGGNAFGQLGDGTKEARSTYVQVALSGQCDTMVLAIRII